MEKLLYSVWSIWAIIVFIVIGSFFLIPMALILLLFSGEKIQNFCILLFKYGGYLCLFLIGIIPIFEGDYNALKGHKKFVFIANHRAYLDILIGVLFTPSNTRFLSKVEVFSWPIIGFFTTRLGHIPVDRSDPKARFESLQKIKQNVKDGKSLILFPEGRIHKNTNLLNTFQNGAFLTAVETQTPIVCLTLLNAGIINPSHSKSKIRPGIIKVKFSKPFSTLNKTKADIDDIKKRTFKEMLGHLEQYHTSGEYPLK